MSFPEVGGCAFWGSLQRNVQPPPHHSQGFISPGAPLLGQEGRSRSLSPRRAVSLSVGACTAGPRRLGQACGSLCPLVCDFFWGHTGLAAPVEDSAGTPVRGGGCSSGRRCPASAPVPPLSTCRRPLAYCLLLVNSGQKKFSPLNSRGNRGSELWRRVCPHVEAEKGHVFCGTSVWAW